MFGRNLSSQRLAIFLCTSIIALLSFAALCPTFFGSFFQTLYSTSSSLSSKTVLLVVLQFIAAALLGRLIITTAIRRDYLVFLIIVIAVVIIALFKIRFPSWFDASLVIFSFIFTELFRCICSWIFFDRLSKVNIYAVGDLSRKLLVACCYVVVFSVTIFILLWTFEASPLLLFSNITLSCLPILFTIVVRSNVAVSWLVLAGYSLLSICFFSSVYLFAPIYLCVYFYLNYSLVCFFDESKESLCSILKTVTQLCSQKSLANYVEIPSPSLVEEDSEEEDCEVNLVIRTSGVHNASIVMDKWNLVFFLSILFLSTMADFGSCPFPLAISYRAVKAVKSWLDWTGWIFHWLVLYFSCILRSKMKTKFERLKTEQLESYIVANISLDSVAIRRNDSIYLV